MRSIIITGATNGIGYECAMKMAAIAKDEQIIIACRDQHAGHEVIRKIRQKTGHQKMICLPLDLASLQSVRDFKAQFSNQPDHKIIALVNNAGIQHITETQYTTDGFETTFGVNHLAPFYLTLLLLPFMDSNASITFTASGVHDPQKKTGIEPPIFKPANELAHPATTNEKAKTVGLRRYSTSKLCNILTTYKLQEKLSGTNISVNAFDPGLVPGTGLARTYPRFLRFVWKNIYPVLVYFHSNINTAPTSGTRLANLAYAGKYKNVKGKYFEGIKEIRSSTDSYNKAYQDMLWASTIELLHINQGETSVPLE
jgi:NAD(P)-dependent dehydrogenase (short-subunit alcohol dehydrogenase family)